MSKRLAQLRDRKAAIVSKLKTWSERLAADAELSTEAKLEIEHLEKQLDLLKPDIALEEKIVQAEEELKAMTDANVAAVKKAAEAVEEKPKKLSIPAAARGHRVKYFKGPDAERDAYLTGLWIIQGPGRKLSGVTHERAEEAARFLRDYAPEMLAQGSAANDKGGYLVPNVMENTIIDLREQYGVFRREADVKSMASEHVWMPRRTSGLTAYFVSENAAIAESEKGWDAVSLTARELATLTRYPRSLAEDAIINLADDLAKEIAYAFSLKEDQCGFVGTGTSTFGGITGAAVKINDGTHAASIAVTDTGDTAFSTLDLDDFNRVVGQLPLFARANAKWYVSAAGFANSMERLMYSVGGNTTSTISAGTGPTFMGYPVVLSQVLNSTLSAQTNAILLLFGDLRMAAFLGSRRGVDVSMSDQRYFEFDQIAIRGTERVDINVHDLGDNTNAGPLVALKTAAS